MWTINRLHPGCIFYKSLFSLENGPCGESLFLKCRIPYQNLAINIDLYLQLVWTCISSQNTYIGQEYGPILYLQLTGLEIWTHIPSHLARVKILAVGKFLQSWTSHLARVEFFSFLILISFPKSHKMQKKFILNK